jgi:hypothetical protein
MSQVLNTDSLEFDEAWYLANYPDVAIAVKSGLIGSGFVHYMNNGKLEGRFASAQEQLNRDTKRVFAMGAYGTNNVGDEAIFDGIRVEIADCIPIHIGKSTRTNAVFFETALREHNFFRSTDRLIIGGGGLLYDPRAINVLIRVAQMALKNKANVEILGLGCEAAQDSFYNEIVMLTKLADRITVRSSISQEIIKKITGRLVERQDDFAFNLSRLGIGPSTGSMDSVPNIGVVTSGDVLEDVKELCRIIRTYTVGNRVANFFHIPHSKAYFDFRNNDVIVGESIWSSIEIHYGAREARYVTEPFSADPTQTLSIYKKLDGVVSRRYHGLLFSKIMNVPYLAMNSSSLKNRSFIDDNKSELTHVSFTNDDLFGSFERFYDNILARKQR